MIFIDTWILQKNSRVVGGVKTDHLCDTLNSESRAYEAPNNDDF